MQSFNRGEQKSENAAQKEAIKLEIQKSESVPNMSLTFGRAEYGKKISSSFEGVPARYILAPIISGEGTGMLIGSRGTGKTHLLLLLAREMPVKIYELDKKKLQEGVVKFEAIRDQDKPKVIVIDDLHYLTKTTNISSLRSGPLSENAIIEKLEGIAEESKSIGAKLILVSAESTFSSAWRFRDESNRLRFLKLVDGCFDNSDDKAYLQINLDKVYDGWRQNVVNLDYRGSLAYHESLIVGAADFTSAIHAIKITKTPLEGYLNESDRTAFYSVKRVVSFQESLNSIASVPVIMRNLPDLFAQDFGRLFEKFPVSFASVHGEKANPITATFLYPGSLDEETVYPLIAKWQKTDKAGRASMFADVTEKLLSSPDLARTYSKFLDETLKAVNSRISRIDVDMETSFESMNKRIARELKLKDVPYTMYEGAREVRYNIDDEGYVDSSIAYVDGERLSPTKPIATFRQLMVVSKILGEISVNKLGLKVGKLDTNFDGKVKSIEFKLIDDDQQAKRPRSLFSEDASNLLTKIRKKKYLGGGNLLLNQPKEGGVDALGELETYGYIKLEKNNDKSFKVFLQDLGNRDIRRAAIDAREEHRLVNELDVVRNKILQIYEDAVGHHPKDLIANMLRSETPEETHAVIIEHDLRLE